MEKLIQLLDFIFFMICVLGLVVLLIMPLANQVFYVIDTLVGNWGHKIIQVAGNVMKLQNRPCYRKLYKMLSPKEQYYRYETPLYTFILAYLGVCTVYDIFLSSKDELLSIIVLSFIYLFCYLLGMYRKYGRNLTNYKRVLDMNMEYLQLFFIPFSFIVTIVGFILSLTDIYKFEYEYTSLMHLFENLLSIKEIASGMYTLNFFILATDLFIWLALYSLPLQLVAYFLLKIIDYFLKNGKPYVLYYKKVFEHIKEFFYNN